MAKVTDYAQVQAEITRQLDSNPASIEAIIGREMTVMVILNIYMTNDVCVGFGQDLNQKVSVISSRRKISIIIDGHSSFYQDDGVICLYEDLADDIAEILIIMEAAYQRIDFDPPRS